MEPTKKRGNPTFKAVWSKPADKVIRVPEYLVDALTSLARRVDSGKIKQSELNKLCLDNEAIAEELDKIAGKPSLTIVPDPISSNELLGKIEQFEELQKQSWGKSAKQTGEFSTNSPRWTKYNEFKAWLQKSN